MMNWNGGARSRIQNQNNRTNYRNPNNNTNRRQFFNGRNLYFGGGPESVQTPQTPQNLCPLLLNSKIFPDGDTVALQLSLQIGIGQRKGPPRSTSIQSNSASGTLGNNEQFQNVSDSSMHDRSNDNGCNRSIVGEVSNDENNFSQRSNNRTADDPKSPSYSPASSVSEDSSSQRVVLNQNSSGRSRNQSFHGSNSNSNGRHSSISASTPEGQLERSCINTGEINTTSRIRAPSIPPTILDNSSSQVSSRHQTRMDCTNSNCNINGALDTSHSSGKRNSGNHSNVSGGNEATYTVSPKSTASEQSPKRYPPPPSGGRLDFRRTPSSTNSRDQSQISQDRSRPSSSSSCSTPKYSFKRPKILPPPSTLESGQTPESGSRSALIIPSKSSVVTDPDNNITVSQGGSFLQRRGSPTRTFSQASASSFSASQSQSENENQNYRNNAPSTSIPSTPITSISRNSFYTPHGSGNDYRIANQRKTPVSSAVYFQPIQAPLSSTPESQEYYSASSSDNENSDFSHENRAPISSQTASANTMRKGQPFQNRNILESHGGSISRTEFRGSKSTANCTVSGGTNTVTRATVDTDLGQRSSPLYISKETSVTHPGTPNGFQSILHTAASPDHQMRNRVLAPIFSNDSSSRTASLNPTHETLVPNHYESLLAPATAAGSRKRLGNMEEFSSSILLDRDFLFDGLQRDNGPAGSGTGANSGVERMDLNDYLRQADYNFDFDAMDFDENDQYLFQPSQERSNGSRGGDDIYPNFF